MSSRAPLTCRHLEAFDPRSRFSLPCKATASHEFRHTFQQRLLLFDSWVGRRADMEIVIWTYNSAGYAFNGESISP